MTAAPCSPEPYLQGCCPAGSFHNPYKQFREKRFISGTCGHGTDFLPRNVLMTDASPRAEECVGLVHPVTKGYGLVCRLLLVVVLAFGAPALGATITISPGQSIATAITDAGSGGTVILNPGTYYQNDIVVGNDVTIRADTANGHGPSDTIVDAERYDRIFDDSGNHALAIDNLTLQNGLASDSSSHLALGGAIYTVSGTVMVTSSTFTLCSASSSGTMAAGGAIYTNSGPVTVTSSTFTACSASSRHESLGGAISTNSGRVTVIASTFTACSASSEDISLGGAIQTNSGSMTVTSTAFIACSASSRSMAVGGAIYAQSGGTIRFSRLVNDDIGTALVGPMNAADNWWGSDSNPSGHLANGATATTWLVPGITASPVTVAEGETSVISANLTYDNTGAPVAGGTFGPDGTLVRFTATGGTVAPEYVGTKNGIASTTFTPSGAGTAYITATVDQQSVPVPVTVTTPAAGTNVTSIVIDPLAPANVYAGLDGSGIYRSRNAGSSWTNTGTQPANLHIRALAINPTLTSRLWAGTYGGGVFRSVNSGADWAACTVPANPYVLSLVRNASGSLYAGTDNGIFVSSDDCNTWIAINGGLP
jgi:hypothetical protein